MILRLATQCAFFFHGLGYSSSSEPRGKAGSCGSASPNKSGQAVAGGDGRYRSAVCLINSSSGSHCGCSVGSTVTGLHCIGSMNAGSVRFRIVWSFVVFASACSYLSASRTEKVRLIHVSGFCNPSPLAPVFDFRAHSCHSALMETHASGFKLRATPWRAKSDLLSVGAT